MNSALLHYFDLAGLAVFALSGVLAAGRKQLDWFGVMVVALITAVGGGTVRDLLLDRHPIFWLKEPVYLWVILCSALFSLIIIRALPQNFRAEQKKTVRSFQSGLLIADSLGLGYFCIQGALIAQHAGMAPLSVVFLGTLTGVGGGLLRDVLTSEIPLILRREIYATAAIAGIMVYLALPHFGISVPWAMVVGASTIVVLRLIAIVWNIHAPTFDLPSK